MKRTVIIALVLLAGIKPFYAQRAADGLAAKKRYSQKEALDSTGGISMYTRLINALKGDSVTYNRSGYYLQGWNEDFYTSGKLLHRGYYIDGKLITFKNFYENGNCERSFANPDPLHCTLDVFFDNGVAARQIRYYNGKPQKSYEFYESGRPKSAIETDKEMKYLTLKKTWYDNGSIESDLELVDLKNKRYAQKTYYTNGRLKGEGTIMLVPASGDYIKDGLWFYYDQDGKTRHSEKHSQPIKVSSR